MTGQPTVCLLRVRLHQQHMHVCTDKNPSVKFGNYLISMILSLFSEQQFTRFVDSLTNTIQSAV